MEIIAYAIILLLILVLIYIRIFYQIDLSIRPRAKEVFRLTLTKGELL